MKNTISLVLTAFVFLQAFSCASGEPPGDDISAISEDDSFEVPSDSGVPSLIDLGSTSCVPCRMMENELSMLDSLTGNDLEVRFIDVNASPEEASEYGIRLIPTQIFMSGSGSELYRHEGFISCDDMIARWAELGFSFSQTGE